MQTPHARQSVMQRRFLLFIPALILGGCIASAPHQTPPRVPTGTWGGLGMELELTESGGQIRYDCASGVISEALHPDAQGYFVAQGSHTRHSGVELPPHLQPPPEAVTYNGQIHGNTLSLRVHNATGEDYGRFELTRNQQASLHPCL